MVRKNSFLQSGFTLIELMIVIAIISILAAVALPAYSDYTKRGQVTEIIFASTTCKSTVAEIYQSGPTTLPSPNGWGCELTTPSSKFVKSVTTDANGVITVTSQNIGDSLLDAKTVSLTPTNSSGSSLTMVSAIVTNVSGWKCGPGSVNPMPATMLPSTCRSQ